MVRRRRRRKQIDTIEEDEDRTRNCHLAFERNYEIAYDIMVMNLKFTGSLFSCLRLPNPLFQLNNMQMPEVFIFVFPILWVKLER